MSEIAETDNWPRPLPAATLGQLKGFLIASSSYMWKG